jgi:hypothetical protein
MTLSKVKPREGTGTVFKELLQKTKKYPKETLRTGPGTGANEHSVLRPPRWVP